MDLSTSYLGFELEHPLVPGASPMSDDIGKVKALEDAGAPMIVMHSLFEEQIVGEQLATVEAMDEPSESYGEATSYWPASTEFRLGPDEYLDQVRKIREAVSIPVVASLNGITNSGWLEYAKLIEQAGAQALELNVYYVATDLERSSESVENEAIEMVREIKKQITIPLAVKLSPFYTSLSNFVKRLDEAGADAVVLFNRFYQPDIDIENLELTRLNLSSRTELLLRIRWLAILHGRLKLDLSASGGVHGPSDVIKAVMAGANSVQMVSALLMNGPDYLIRVKSAVAAWLEEHEYDSLNQAQGSMSLLRCPDPSAYERANYAKLLQSWEPE